MSYYYAQSGLFNLMDCIFYPKLHFDFEHDEN